MTAPCLIKLTYRGPQEVESYLLRRLKEAGYEIATTDATHRKPFTLKVRCRLVLAYDQGAYYPIQKVSTDSGEMQIYPVFASPNERPVAHPYRIEASVKLARSRFLGTLLKQRLTGQQPRRLEVRGEPQPFLKEFAINSLKPEVDRLLWVSIPAATANITGVIAALQHESPHVRAAAAQALGLAGDRKAVGPLLGHLTDSAESDLTREGKRVPMFFVDSNRTRFDGEPVRLICAQALARLGWRPGNEAERVKVLAATQSFQEICTDPAAEDVLIELLSDPVLNTELNAIKSLEQLGSHRAVIPLIRKLDDLWRAETDPTDLRYQLNKFMIGPDNLFSNFFQQAANGDTKTDSIYMQRLKACVVALGKIGNERALEVLISCLKHSDEAFRNEVAQALRNITGQDLGLDHAKWLSWWRDYKKLNKL